MPSYRLITSETCPFAQRSRVMLHEKGVDCEVVFIDLADKPDWFVEMSPTGKVPTVEVTRDDGSKVVLFESLVINQYLEEIAGGIPMMPSDPLEKAHAQAWAEYATALLQDCFALTAAADADSLADVLGRVVSRLDRLEKEVRGSFFLGEAISTVDVAFVPALQRLKFADELKPDMGLYGDHRPMVTRWWQSIRNRPSVAASMPDDIRERFHTMIGRDRGGYRSVIGELAAANSAGPKTAVS